MNEHIINQTSVSYSYIVTCIVICSNIILLIHIVKILIGYT